MRVFMHHTELHLESISDLRLKTTSPIESGMIPRSTVAICFLPITGGFHHKLGSHMELDSPPIMSNLWVFVSIPRRPSFLDSAHLYIPYAEMW